MLLWMPWVALTMLWRDPSIFTFGKLSWLREVWVALYHNSDSLIVQRIQPLWTLSENGSLTIKVYRYFEVCKVDEVGRMPGRSLFGTFTFMIPTHCMHESFQGFIR